MQGRLARFLQNCTPHFEFGFSSCSESASQITPSRAADRRLNQSSREDRFEQSDVAADVANLHVEAAHQASEMYVNTWCECWTVMQRLPPSCSFPHSPSQGSVLYFRPRGNLYETSPTPIVRGSPGSWVLGIAVVTCVGMFFGACFG